MDKDTTDILLAILEQLDSESLDVDTFVEELVLAGIDPHSLKKLLTWLLGAIEARGIIYQGSPQYKSSRRVLHRSEKRMISNDVRSYLVDLENREVVGSAELESLIERAIWMGSISLPLDELKSFANRAIPSICQSDDK